MLLKQHKLSRKVYLSLVTVNARAPPTAMPLHIHLLDACQCRVLSVPEQ